MSFSEDTSEEIMEPHLKEELLWRFKLLRRQYQGYSIPEDLELRSLQEIQSIYRETIDRLHMEQKAKYVNIIKEIYKSMRSDHPEELDDPKYIEVSTTEDIQNLCKSKGLDLEQMANIYAIIKTVAIASSSGGDGAEGQCNVQ